MLTENLCPFQLNVWSGLSSAAHWAHRRCLRVTLSPVQPRPCWSCRSPEQTWGSFWGGGGGSSRPWVPSPGAVKEQGCDVNINSYKCPISSTKWPSWNAISVFSFLYSYFHGPQKITQFLCWASVTYLESLFVECLLYLLMPYPPQHHCHGYTLGMIGVLPPFGVFLNSALWVQFCFFFALAVIILCHTWEDRFL